VKPSQQLIYAARIDKVLTHLVSRLAEGVSPGLEELAGVAALSEYHFHRVFRLMTGETLSSAVQRLRLANSLSALTSPHAKVADASALGAYATSQSYARALKARTGSVPTDARCHAAEIDRIRENLRRPADARSAGDSAAPLSVEIVAFEPLTIIALRNVGDYAGLYDAYARLFGLLTDVSAVMGIYGVPYDDPTEIPAAECRFDLGVSLTDFNVAAGILELRELRIEATSCVRLRQAGSYERTWSNLDSLYSYVLSNGEWSFGSSPPVIHYLDDPEVVRTEDLRADLYLPVREIAPDCHRVVINRR
jgi:AraC family transcriptional regulator